jgi:hypothetical protein
MNHSAIYYANYSIANETIHIIYSSFDELTINIFSTYPNHGAKFDYSALLAKNYSSAIQFGEITPKNSFAFILRRLFQFNDRDDTGRMNDNDNTTIEYSLRDIVITNATLTNSSTNQPTFELAIPSVNYCYRSSLLIVRISI